MLFNYFGCHLRLKKSVKEEEERCWNPKAFRHCGQSGYIQPGLTRFNLGVLRSRERLAKGLNQRCLFV